MPLTSIHDPSLAGLLHSLRHPSVREADVNGRIVTVPTPFPSPADWRDVPMYQLLIDRFNNPDAPPRAQWDGHNRYVFQGGTFEGIRQKLDYLLEMGVRAIWMSPVQKNCAYRPTYHGYAVQDFLAVEPRYTSDPEHARRDPAFADAELRWLIDDAHARGIYVIFDIVLHHAGDVFAYELEDGLIASKAPASREPYPVLWRDEKGVPREDWTDAADIPLDAVEAGVWPIELRRNEHFFRLGGGAEETDFKSLKAIITDGSTASRSILVRCHKYLIAKFDVDGFRVDAFKHIDRGFGRIFCSAMREFAESVGKKNFFIFCEVFDGEDTIAQYVGRNTVTHPDDMMAADAALDFPLMFILPDVAKGIKSPGDLAHMYAHRQEVEKHILSTHGEASKFFVTFLDNHDQYHRVHYSLPDKPHAYDDQLEIALGLLACLQGIPCIYYGTEQGMHGRGEDEEAVREALWGAPRPFDTSHPFYVFLKDLYAVRAAQPPLRYGRQYFRDISTDTVNFSTPAEPGSPVAFSRILSEQEILIVANTSLTLAWSGQIIVDRVLNAEGEPFDVLLTNKTPKPVAHAVTYVDGHARYLPVLLEPGEIQILSNRQ